MPQLLRPDPPSLATPLIPSPGLAQMLRPQRAPPLRLVCSVHGFGAGRWLGEVRLLLAREDVLRLHLSRELDELSGEDLGDGSNG